MSSASSPHRAVVCAHHPERQASGVCVRCRARLCGECTTKLDGINYCASCLATLADDEARRGEGDDGAAKGRPALEVMWLLVGVCALTLACWGLLVLGAAW